MPGILDWFTLLTGLTLVALLTLQGASFLVMKTRGELQARAEALAKSATVLLVLLLVALVVALPSVQPAFVSAVRQRPFVGFVASSVSVASLLVAAAWGIFPNLLIATTGQANSLTSLNAATDRTGLEAGLWWVPPGLALVILYQVQIHRLFARPAKPGSSPAAHH